MVGEATHNVMWGHGNMLYQLVLHVELVTGVCCMYSSVIKQCHPLCKGVSSILLKTVCEGLAGVVQEGCRRVSVVVQEGCRRVSGVVQEGCRNGTEGLSR